MPKDFSLDSHSDLKSESLGPSKRFTTYSRRNFDSIEWENLSYHCTKKAHSIAWSCYFEKKMRKPNNFQDLIYKQSKFIQNLGIIDCYEYFYLDKNLSFLRRGLRGFVILRKFEMELCHSRVSNTGLRNLRNALGRCSLLKSFRFWFPRFERVDDKRLGLLTKGFRVHISLQNLNLNINEGWEITDSGISNLCKGLKKLVLLRCLKIRFSDCYQVTDKGLMDIKKALQKFRKMEEVDLGFIFSENISLDGVIYLFEGVEDLPLLQKTCISFFNESFVRKSINNLVMVEFSFRDFRDEKIDLKSFGVFLANFPDLCDLKIEFCRLYQMRNSELKHLGQIIQTFTSLKRVEFKFEKCYEIDDEGLKILGHFIKDLVNLTELNLEFSKFFKFTGKGFRFLAQTLKNMISLQKIDLRFHGCKKFRDCGMLVIVKSLEDFRNLKEFNFVTSSSRITKAGRQKFMKTLKSHRSLQKADVDFGFGHQVIDFVDKRVLLGEIGGKEACLILSMQVSNTASIRKEKEEG